MKWTVLLLVLLVLGGTFYWQVQQFQKPFTPQDIPEWKIQTNTNDQWTVYAAQEPKRQTSAWFVKNTQMLQCDTLILLGGLDEGANLVQDGVRITNHGNLIGLRHPLNQFATENPWQTWSVWDWLRSPVLLKEEMAHTVGALTAILNYVHDASTEDAKYFTKNVIMGGGSFGAPFTAMVSSFDSTKVAALMIIYGFTNYELVISRDLERQGLKHFKLDAQNATGMDQLKVWGLQGLAKTLGFVFGNMFKYGSMEYYLPQVQKTPIYFINGREDHLVPKEAFDPMWNSAPSPKYQEWIDGDHINPGDSNEMAALVKRMHQWSQSQNLWRCQNPMSLSSQPNLMH